MKAKLILTVSVLIMLASLTSSAFAQTNYALGKPYSADPALTPTASWWLGEDPPYTKWTDGTSAWGWGTVSGWQGPDNVSSATLIVDLGETKNDIGKVQVDQFVSHSSTVYESSQIKCYGTDDSTSPSWTYWGDLATSGSTGAETMWYWVYKSASCKSARYVKYELYWDAGHVGSHKLNSEIYVWSWTPTPPYAPGGSYTVNPPLTPTSQYWLGEDPPYTKWTDGVSAWAWGAVSGWQGPDNVSSATIVLDLGEIKPDIHKVQVDQFVSHSSAVWESSQMKCYGSDDNVTFTYWGDLAISGAPGGETMWYWAYASLPDLHARYVKYELYWDPGHALSHKLNSEIHVWSVEPPSGVEDWELY